jgi:hypothetical protein
MTYRSPGRFWVPCPSPARLLLMYTRATSLSNLYIRNIIPDDIGIPLLEHLALSGRGYALFTRVRGIGIARTSPFGDSRKLDFHFTEFYEVRIHRILGSWPRIHREFIDSC